MMRMVLCVILLFVLVVVGIVISGSMCELMLLVLFLMVVKCFSGFLCVVVMVMFLVRFMLELLLMVMRLL